MYTRKIDLMDEGNLYNRGFISAHAQDFDTTIHIISKLIANLNPSSHMKPILKIIYLGFKGALDKRRYSWRILKQINVQNTFVNKILNEYIHQIEAEIYHLCGTADIYINKILELLASPPVLSPKNSNSPLNSVSTFSNQSSANVSVNSFTNTSSSYSNLASSNSSPNVTRIHEYMKNNMDFESRGELLKFRADLKRYVAEINRDSQSIQEAGILYEKAKQGVPTDHYIYMAIILNQAIFMYEVLDEKKGASNLLKKTIAGVNPQIADSCSIINTMQENLDVWGCF